MTTLTPDDRDAIGDLMARYCWANDAGDAEAFASVFTEDGLYESHGQAARGLDEIRAVFESRVAARPAQPITNPQHWMTNLLVEEGAAGARAKSYFTRVVRDKGTGEPRIDALGWFDDDLRMDNGAWRFARRSVRLDIGPWERERGTETR